MGFNASMKGADYARGKSVGKAKGISYGDGLLSDPDFVRISQMCNYFNVTGGNFNNSQVGRRVPPYKSSGNFPAVSHSYSNFLGFGDHMVIRQNVPFLIYYKTRSLSLPRSDLKPKIHAECRSCNVHYGRMRLLKDADVDLFIG